jgi:hypothetical protein
VFGTWYFRATTTEDLCGPHRALPVYKPLPAGVRIAVRASNGSNGLGVAVHALS